ncbi:hypothetical protein [Paenibacillus glycanilyticus]|nr:hypothetical protein [Paenibacillus glycanilyticus]
MAVNVEQTVNLLKERGYSVSPERGKRPYTGLIGSRRKPLNFSRTSV